MGAVLVAISIPIFTQQLERSRDAVTVSNIRAAYAMSQTAYLTQQSDTANNVTYVKDLEDVKSFKKYTVSDTLSTDYIVTNEGKVIRHKIRKGTKRPTAYEKVEHDFLQISDVPPDNKYIENAEE